MTLFVWYALRQDTSHSGLSRLAATLHATRVQKAYAVANNKRGLHTYSDTNVTVEGNKRDRGFPELGGQPQTSAAARAAADQAREVPHLELHVARTHRVHDVDALLEIRVVRQDDPFVLVILVL